jgi:hypothetical protein
VSPFNREGAYISYGHVHQSSRVGTRVHAGNVVYELHGPLNGFDRTCGTVQARITPIVGGAAVSEGVGVLNADPRDVLLRLPEFSEPGLYRIEIGYPRRGDGLFGNDCFSSLDVVSYVLPVASIPVYGFSYALTPTCSYTRSESRATGEFGCSGTRDGGCSVSRTIVPTAGGSLSSPRCRHVTGSGCSQESIAGGGAQISFTINCPGQDCHCGPFGICACGAQPSRVVACEADEVIPYDQAASALEGSASGLAPGTSRVFQVLTESTAIQPGANCSWTLEASVLLPDNTIVDLASASGRAELRAGGHGTALTWNPAAGSLTLELPVLACEEF